MLEINNLDIVEFFIRICTYNHPDGIKLPKGYRPPHLAILAMYWKTWLLLLIISCYNPANFGMYTGPSDCLTAKPSLIC